MELQTIKIIDVINNELKLNSNFDKILQKIQTDKISILTINGALRSGKSFILNYLLKFLFPDKDFNFFNWSHGYESCTQGMWMLSEPIILKNNNEDISLLILDTQGLFDGHLDTKVSTSLFAFSSLISSYQIYNIDKRLQENHLQYLELFSEYARMVRTYEGLNDSAPFQNLHFLIRDWQFFNTDNDLEKNIKDNNEYFVNFLTKSNTIEGENMRNNILNCYQNINCSMLPHPGFEISKNNYNGDLSKISEEFNTYSRFFIQNVLTSIEPKKILNRYINKTNIKLYWETYLNILNNKIPKPLSLLNAQIKLNHYNLNNECLQKYQDEMNKFINHKLTNKQLIQLHSQTKTDIYEYFNKNLLLGSEEEKQKSTVELFETIEKVFNEYKQINISKNKNINKIIAICVLYLLKIISSNLDFIGIFHTINVFSAVCLYSYILYFIYKIQKLDLSLHFITESVFGELTNFQYSLSNLFSNVNSIF